MMNTITPGARFLLSLIVFAVLRIEAHGQISEGDFSPNVVIYPAASGSSSAINFSGDPYGASSSPNGAFGMAYVPTLTSGTLTMGTVQMTLVAPSASWQWTQSSGGVSPTFTSQMTLVAPHNALTLFAAPANGSQQTAIVIDPTGSDGISPSVSIGGAYANNASIALNGTNAGITINNSSVMTVATVAQGYMPLPYAANNSLGIGNNVLSANTTGGNNVGFGPDALAANTEGFCNVAVGPSSLQSNTEGSYNTAIGIWTLGHNVGDFSTNAGMYNGAIGAAAMASNTTGSHNNAFGFSALANNTTGGGNTALGDYALYGNTTGFSNVGVGAGALAQNTIANYNVAVGNNSLTFNQYGFSNTAVGYQAMLNSVGIDQRPLPNDWNGSYNCAFGYYALFSSTISENNVALGSGALQADVNGNGNVAVGGGALGANVHGGLNVAIGTNTGGNVVGNNNIIIGAGIQAPNLNGNNDNQIDIGNIIYGTGVDGQGNGNIGIGTSTPAAKLDVAGVVHVLPGGDIPMYTPPTP